MEKQLKTFLPTVTRTNLQVYFRVCSSSLIPHQPMMASFELLHILCFQTRDSVTPKLKQWVQLVVSSCGDRLPTESRLAAAEILTSTTPFFLTNPHPILGKCPEWEDVHCTQCAKSMNRSSNLKRREDGKWQYIALYLYIVWIYSHPLSSYSNHFSPTASSVASFVSVLSPTPFSSSPYASKCLCDPSEIQIWSFHSSLWVGSPCLQGKIKTPFNMAYKAFPVLCLACPFLLGGCHSPTWALCVISREQFYKHTAASLTSVCLSKLRLTVTSSRNPVTMSLVRNEWVHVKLCLWGKRRDRLERHLGNGMDRTQGGG